MPSGRDYANRLLDEANRTFAPHLSGLQEALQSLRNHLTASLEQLVPKFEAIKTVDMVATGNILSEAIEEVRRQRLQEIALLAEFGRDLRKKETQEEILSLLLDAAHRYAPHVALLALRGTRFLGWSSRGYADETARKIRESQTDCSASPSLLQAAGADQVITIPSMAGDGVLSQFLPGGPVTVCHLLPMRAMNRTVAVLLAADGGDLKCDLNALQILIDLTGLYLESLALRILQEMKPEETPEVAPRAAARVSTEMPVAPFVTPVQPSTPVATVESAAPAVEPPAQAAPFEPVAPPVEPSVPVSPAEQVAPPAYETPIAVQPPAVEPEPVPAAPAAEIVTTAEEPARPEPAGEPAAPTILAAEPEVAVPVSAEPARSPKDVDREIEALMAALGGPVPTAAPEVPDVSAEAVTPAIQVPEPVIPHPIAEVKAPTEEEKLHADARRFARLLVSEIKLYNEQRLTEGRENRDIYVRLKRDIDKSREMYERRVPVHVSRKFDYFNDEVVRILAENDPAKLGSDYPGPRVES